MTPAELEAIRGKDAGYASDIPRWGAIADRRALLAYVDELQRASGSSPHQLRQRAESERDTLRAENQRLRETLEYVRQQAEHALASVERPRGMHVPWHGWWASAVRHPACQRDLRELATSCTRALGDEREGGAPAEDRIRRAAPALLDAAEMAQDALDRLMGDSDLDDDDSLECRAMQALGAAIDAAKGGGG